MLPLTGPAGVPVGSSLGSSVGPEVGATDGALVGATLAAALLALVVPAAVGAGRVGEAPGAAHARTTMAHVAMSAHTRANGLVTVICLLHAAASADSPFATAALLKQLRRCYSPRSTQSSHKSEVRLKL